MMSELVGVSFLIFPNYKAFFNYIQNKTWHACHGIELINQIAVEGPILESYSLT